MLNEHLALLWTNVHSVEHTSIRLYESDPISKKECILIQNALFLWFGIALEKASAVLSESNFRNFGGRLVKEPASILRMKEGLSSFLSMLDEVDDIIDSIISTDSSRFKAKTLYKELHRCLNCWSSSLWRALSPLFSALFEDISTLTVDTVRFLRQLSNLLSKIHIDRKDLLAESNSDYLYSEFLSSAETSCQESKSFEYTDLCRRIRVELSDVIQSFTMNECIPKHGPGAVADPAIKTRIEKFLNMGFDSRIDYLLRKSFDETMRDYSPFPLLEQARTSRVVFVPKSWKKLRGISAEPVGLQYFQQAVLRALKKSISRSRLKSLIKLRDQSVSGRKALQGSRDGSLATIDLSSASDSVTLRLVKDIFGNTDLCRWLLATRSTHTLLGQERMEIKKFAPMGSACCFPVECLVFAGIVLASATRNFGSRCMNMHDFQVYGDDIICPAFMAPDIMEDLVTMGFTVNSDKSYWQGDYRESCGTDAWCGSDVTPLKLQDFSFDFDGSEPCSYEHHSRVVSYLNFLYANGYKSLRSFLLEKFLRGCIVIGKQKVRVSKSLVFGDGSRGTILSCQPDNFHIETVPLKGLFRLGFKLVGWKARYKPLSQQEEILVDEVDYFESLMSRRALDCDELVSYDLAYFRSLDSKAKVSTKLGQRMVPTIRTHDPWYK